MPDDDDKMEVEACIRLLNEALALQHRSVLQYSLSAGSVTGLEYVGLADRLSEYAQEELADARRMVEKIRVLGGDPSTKVAALKTASGAKEIAKLLIANEREALVKLHEVIPHSGQEARSEALEHFIEHLLSRKQEQVDALLRAVGETE